MSQLTVVYFTTFFYLMYIKKFMQLHKKVHFLVFVQCIKQGHQKVIFLWFIGI